MLSSSLVRKILIILSALLLPIELWSAVPARAVEIRLEPEVKVAGEAVVLGDVATIYAKSIHDFNNLSNLTLAAFPSDSAELKLPKGYLTNRIREALPKGVEFRLFAPTQVVFRQNRVGVTPQEFAAEIIRRGRAEGKIPEWAEAEVQPLAGFDQLKLAKLSDLQVDPAAEMLRWKGEMAFKLSHPGKTDGTLQWVKVKVRWFTQAWVAKRALGILSVIGPHDFEKGRVEITALREDPLLASEDLSLALTSARARRSIQMSSPLTSAAIEKAPDAKPGQPLKVVFVSESGIRVTTDGSLLGSGSVGNEVRAKLHSSRKTVTGKLVTGGMMEVSL
jgi:flagella basal body P-ring formation protein FlgA